MAIGVLLQPYVLENTINQPSYTHRVDHFCTVFMYFRHGTAQMQAVNVKGPFRATRINVPIWVWNLLDVKETLKEEQDKIKFCDFLR